MDNTDILLELQERINTIAASRTIDMVEAAGLLQVFDSRVARRILIREGIALSKDRRGYLVVSQKLVEELAKRRGGKVPRGRKKKVIDTY